MTARAKQHHSLKTKFRYRFDAALSRGPAVVIAWLGLITLAIVIVSSLILTIFSLDGVHGDPRVGFWEDFWQSILRLLDPGTFSGDAGWFTRVVMLLVTLSGVFIAGSLIGVISNGIDQRVEDLRKGRSTVLESDHTVILGWSERVPPIVSELVIANESRKRAAVVILADSDKPEMEDTLKDAIDDTKGTKIVCRTGDPWSLESLALANIAGARSVVIVGADDAAAVKTVLAVKAHQQTAPQGQAFTGSLVVEVEAAETAASLRSLFGDQLVTVRSTDIVAELTAQACRQRGLSEVFREFLDFDGDEFYIEAFPTLVGKTYAETQLAFDRCAVVGVLSAAGTVTLNPPAASVFGPGDQLIGIAEDDSLFVPTPGGVRASVVATEPRAVATELRRIVIAGWSRIGPRVIQELDEFLEAGTRVDVLIDPDKVDVAEARDSVQTRNLSVNFEEVHGGPEAVVSYAARETFHEAIVLGYRDAMSIHDADARTLLTLVGFRQVKQDASVGDVRIVAEVLDQRNARLAQASGVDDFIVSDELTSLMLAQLSERAELIQVFDDLFDREGCAVELRPAPWYGSAAAQTFGDIVATGSAQGVSVIGYLSAASGNVVLNPSKSADMRLDHDDLVVVIASSLGA